MKKTIKNTIFIILLVITTVSCEKLFMDNYNSDSPKEIYDYLWQQVDKRYSLFDVKEVDWNAMYDSLLPEINDNMGDDSLFAVLHKMLNSLNDGHVDLWGNDDISSSEEIYLQRYGNSNFNLNTVAVNYLGANHHTTGGMTYNAIANGQVLYIRYSSFSNSATTSQFEKVISRYPNVKGIVFDIRQNGGGEIQNEWNIMTLLPDNGQLLYYTQMKNGPAHDDFSAPEAVYAPKNDNHTPFTKPFVLLTDRGCYSAASSFALCLKTYNNVVVMGDTTAGGLAIPAGGALPNGWYYRFGVSRTIAPDGINYENGVPPDIVVTLNPTATAAGKDNIIDSACSVVINSTKQ